MRRYLSDVMAQLEHLTRLARLSAEPLRWMRKLRGKVSALCEPGVPLSSGTASGVPCTSGLAPGALRRLCAPADPSASPPERLDALRFAVTHLQTTHLQAHGQNRMSCLPSSSPPALWNWTEVVLAQVCIWDAAEQQVCLLATLSSRL